MGENMKTIQGFLLIKAWVRIFDLQFQNKLNCTSKISEPKDSKMMYSLLEAKDEAVEADLCDNIGLENLYFEDCWGFEPFLGESPIGLLIVYDT